MVYMLSKDRHIRNVPDDLWHRVRVQAAVDGVSLREFVIRALERAIQEGKNESKTATKGRIQAG